MIIKDFDINSEYSGSHYTNTLPPECIGLNESGWIISGEIHEDYFYWVNEFEVIQHTYGKVWGNFERKVFADSGLGYENFIQNHPPSEWVYHDI